MSVPLTGTISTYPSGQYPTHDSATAIDGWRAVADHTARNAIPNYLRRRGMAVWTQSDGLLWTLNPSPWAGSDADWTQFSGSGTVSSVALAMPGIFTVSGSPVTGSGTLTATLLTQSANLVFAGPTTGSAAAPTFRALVAADLPAGTGTVTSLALAMPSEFSVSGSPVTGSGTISVTKTGQNANLVYAGPGSGGPGFPGFRSLVGADLPNPSSSTLGGIQSAAAVAHQWIDSVSTSGVPHLSQPAFSDISGQATLAQLPSIGANTVLGNNTGSSAVPAAVTTNLQVDSHQGVITSDTDGSTVTFNLATSDWHRVTLGGNRTLALSNATVGQQFTVILAQDGTGSRTVTWWSTIKWPGGTAPTLTTAANGVDVFTFKCVNTNVYYGFTAGLDLYNGSRTGAISA
jgi:hypothetical protein